MLREHKETHRLITDDKVSVGWSKDGVVIYTNHRPSLPDPIELNLPAIAQPVYGFGHLSVFQNIQPVSQKNTPELFSFLCDSSCVTIKPAGLFSSLITSKHKKIKTGEALRAQGIPDIFRPYWPILCIGNEPIWVLGGMRTINGYPSEPGKMTVSCVFSNK